jgi:putative nucleotidyltransferase with HDIG domain
MKGVKNKYSFPPGRELPVPPGSDCGELPVPDDAACFAIWDRTDMLENIREHSMAVAGVATFLARRAREVGMEADVEAVRASALLHDIAKTYCIVHGGNHSQLGGAWAAELTGNPYIASGVTHHVFWPFDLDLGRYFLQLAVLYGDKRVTHDRLVDIDDRFEDLLDRYGKSALIRQRMHIMHDQVVAVENMFSTKLKVDLNELTLDSRGLVQRA